MAAFSFLFALMETAWLHPLIFGGVISPETGGQITQKTLWAGLLMPVPLWFLTHKLLLLVFRLLCRPFGYPGLLVLESGSISLRSGKESERFEWSEVTTIYSSSEVLDWEEVNAVGPDQKLGLAIAQVGERIAAKKWYLMFSSKDGRSIKVTSDGFQRPVRRAEPQLRRWLSALTQEEVGPLSEPKCYQVPASW